MTNGPNFLQIMLVVDYNFIAKIVLHNPEKIAQQSFLCFSVMFVGVFRWKIIKSLAEETMYALLRFLLDFCFLKWLLRDFFRIMENDLGNEVVIHDQHYLEKVGSISHDHRNDTDDGHDAESSKSDSSQRETETGGWPWRCQWSSLAPRTFI